MQERSIDSAQRVYARVAGFMFLFVNAAYAFAVLADKSIRGSGGFAETARRVLASEHHYRIALSSGVIACVTTVILGFALYVTLEPVDKRLAQIALCFRLGEAVIFGVMSVLSFAMLRLYATAQAIGPAQDGELQTLLSLGRSASVSGFNIGAIFFAPASILFFHLFYRSRYIPRTMAAFGLCASVAVLPVAFGSLIFPEYARTLFYGWIPMAIAETATGFWLMIVGIRLAPVSVDKVVPT
jgi:hypothetical protein